MFCLPLQWISVPFAMSNPAVSDITVSAKEAIHQSPWLGRIEPQDKWLWLDNFCLLVGPNSVCHSIESLTAIKYYVT